MIPMIYLDNAATTVHKPQEVIDAVVHAMQTMGNSSRGTHSVGLSAAETIFETRGKVARFFGCKRPDHVIFTANVTESLNIALSGLFSPHDHIITTVAEHNSVLRPLYRLEEELDIEISYIPVNDKGVLQYDVLPSLVRPNTKAIICSHASNVTGNITDITRIGAFAHENGLIFIVDAAQTAGVYPVNMETAHIDVLCFTGHKGLFGPQGTGGMCIAEGIEIRPFKVGGTGVQSYLRHQPTAYPTRLEAGTLNGHGIAGLSAALDFIERITVDEIHRKETMLVSRFCSGVALIPGIRIYGDVEHGQEHVGIVSLSVDGMDSALVSFILAEEYGIATRPGAHCAPLLHQALHTADTGLVRFSFSWFTTESEIDAAISALRIIGENKAVAR